MERKITSYETTLEELAELSRTQAFAGQAGFFGWERLEGLRHQLRQAYDAYELEGNVAPVRQAIEGYLADLATRQVRPDARVYGCLERFLADLERPDLDVATHVVDPAVVGRWPSEILTITPEELVALHDALQGQRTSKP